MIAGLKIFVMVIYCVQWFRDKKLCKGKGRATSDMTFTFTVICRNISDATRCLDYYFRFVFSEVNKHNFNIDDGVVTMTRLTIDSRKFEAQYLLLDGMREPLYLPDPSSNLLRAHKIFGR